MRKSRLNFIPFKEAKDEARNQCKGDITINTKNGTMLLSSNYVRDNRLENAFIRFFVDVPKKALAWKILKENELSDMSEYKQIKAQKSGIYLLGIKRVLKLYGFKVPMSFKGLKVEKDYPSYLEGPMSYIKLDNGKEI